MVNSQVFTMFAASIPMRSPKFCKYLAFQPHLRLLHHVTSPIFPVVSQWYPRPPNLLSRAEPHCVSLKPEEAALKPRMDSEAAMTRPRMMAEVSCCKDGKGGWSLQKKWKNGGLQKESGRVHKKNWGIAMGLVDIIMVWIKMSGEQ